MTVLYLCPAISHVTAVCDDGTLTMPYVVFGENIYAVQLILSSGSESVEFLPGPETQYDAGTEAPGNAALFATNVSDIPKVRAGTESYRV